MKPSLTLAYGSALLLALLGLLLISPPAMAPEAEETCAGLTGKDLECCEVYQTHDERRECCKAGLIDTNPTMTPEEETNCDCYRSGDGGPKLNCFSCIAPQQVEDLKLLLKINQVFLAPMNVTLTEDKAAGKVTVRFEEPPGTVKTFEMTLCPCDSPQGQPRFACPPDGMGSILCTSCIHPKQIDDVIGPSPKPYFNVPEEPIPPISFDTEFGCYRIDGLHFVEEGPPVNICIPRCVCEAPPACPTPPTGPPPPPPPPPPAAALEVPLLVCREGERDAYLSTRERVTLDQACPVYPPFKLTDAPPGLLALSEVMAGVVRTGQWSQEANDLSFQYLESALQEKGFFANAGIKGVSLTGYKIVEAPLDGIAQKFLTSEGKIIHEEGGLIELPSTTPVTSSTGQTALTTATRISAAAGLRILTDRIKQQGAPAPAALTVDPFDIPMIVAIRIHSEGSGGCSLFPKDY